MHTMQICYTLGTIATFETEMFFLIFSFMYNIFLCIYIVWVIKQRPHDTDKHISLIQQLAVGEMIEFVCPLAFIVVFIVAFSGPNRTLLGGIGVTIWQYKAIDDVHVFITTLLIYFFLDFSSIFVTSIVLWHSCKINLFKVLLSVEKEHGPTICIFLGFFIMSVSSQFSN